MAEQKPPNIPPRPTRENTFSGGMAQDVDNEFQKPNKYRNANNGRIWYNKDGDFSFVNETGNLISFTLVEYDGITPLFGYHPIGFCEFADKTVIFSTNEVNSEIGYVTVRSNGTGAVYQQIFNDKYDPNGEKFGFSINHKIKKAIPDTESVNIQRVYWTDGVLEPFCINTKLGLTRVSPEFVLGDYAPIGDIGYPWFYSVHSWRQQSDFAMGMIKFTKQLGTPTNPDGALKTGIVRMTYRLVTRDGYATQWYPLTHRYFITLDGINFDLNNQFTRSMYASNVQTEIGMEFEVIQLDSRFYQIEMAYVYSIDKDATVEASIFAREKLSQGQTSITIPFRNMSGDPIDFLQFTKKIVPLKTVQTLEQKDNQQWEGNIETYGDYVIDTSTITIEPFLRNMTVDVLGAETTVADNKGLTNTIGTTTTVTIQKYLDNTSASKTETYQIYNDWTNYRGVQWEHLFPSYWRGETYPFAIVIFNLKGNPFYAQHIQDYTFPEQYENGEAYSLMATAGVIKMMGLKLSGINLPKDKIVDANGRMLASGFAIMRTNRVKRILCQGVVLNTVCKAKSGDPVTDETYPLPMTSNAFDAAYILAKSPDVHRYDQDYKPIASPITLYDDYGNRPYTFTFQSPDIFFQNNFYEGTEQDTVLENADTLKLIEVYACPYELACGLTSGGWLANEPQNNIELTGQHAHYYTKNYHLLTDGESDLPYPKGTETRLKLEGEWSTFNHACNTYDTDNTALTFCTDVEVAIDDSSSCHSENVELSASQVIYTWLIQGKDVKTLAAATNAYKPSYYTANYIVRQSKYYTPADTTSLAHRLYYSTGHFQPLNAVVLAEAPTVTVTINDIPTDCYQFNGVEVWGGDCYPNIFDFTRLYPHYSDGCDTTKHVYTDYAVSMIIPLESDMNYCLREGRSFAKDGTRPEEQACNGGTDFEHGIMIQQPEEFNLNSVLLFKEDINYYTALQPSINPYLTEFPYRWLYSLTKIAGENYDAYRQFLTGNFGDVQGQYGEVIGCAKLTYQGTDLFYSVQETAFGRLRIHDRTAIPTQLGTAIQTGLGETFNGVDYISTRNGTRFPFSILTSYKAFCFADATNDCLVRFALDGTTEITETYEMKNWAQETLGSFDSDRIVWNNGNPSASIFEHIHGVFDEVRDEFRWTLIRKNAENVPDLQQTILFSNNGQLTSFIGFFPDVPFQYFTCNGYIFSQDGIVDGVVTGNNNEKQFIYYKGNKGEWFGRVYDTTVQIVVNPEWKFSKKFDNFIMNVNSNAEQMLKLINFQTLTQNQVLNFATFTQFDYSHNTFRFPIRPQEDRLNGQYLLAEFVFDNNKNLELKFVSNTTKFRFDRPIAP